MQKNLHSGRHFENTEANNGSLNHVVLKLRHLCHGLLRFQVHCRP